MNFILDGNTIIKGDITISGILYQVKNEEALNRLNKTDLNPLSGTFDNIIIEGDLVICEYKEYNLLISGSMITMCTEIVE
jgi:hypothetical protein